MSFWREIWLTLCCIHTIFQMHLLKFGDKSHLITSAEFLILHNIFPVCLVAGKKMFSCDGRDLPQDLKTSLSSTIIFYFVFCIFIYKDCRRWTQLIPLSYRELKLKNAAGIRSDIMSTLYKLKLHSIHIIYFYTRSVFQPISQDLKVMRYPEEESS